MASPVYLLVHSHAAGEWSHVALFLDGHPQIDHWMYFLPNTFLIRSPLSALELSDRIQSFVGDNAGFLVTQVSGNFWGRLPGKAWQAILGEDNANTPYAPSSPR